MSRHMSNDVVTEDGAALRFAELHADRLRFCHDAGRWFLWTGNVWEENRTGVAFQWARELARALAENEPEKTRFIASKAAFAASVERFARTDSAFAVTSEFWDRDPFLLGTPGGTVDLRTGTLRLSVPGDGISRSTAVAPAENADCPRWLRFLEEATGGDVDMMRFLQQWAGYGLTGDIREHALVFLYGHGGEGKSVFVNTLAGIAGTYAVTAAMDTFVAAHGERHSTDLAMMRGARIVTASETEEGRSWAEARIKSLTGGDPITARFMHCNNFTYRPAFKLTMVANYKPSLHTVDDAHRRRFNIVPFTRKPAQPDRELETKLKAEWSAILRWAICGALDWQVHGLVRPRSVADATADYFESQDVLAQWLDEACDADPGNDWKKAPSGELFKSWTAFAQRAGEPIGSRRTFADALQKRGFMLKKGTAGIREFVGLRLKPEMRSGASGA